MYVVQAISRVLTFSLVLSHVQSNYGAFGIIPGGNILFDMTKCADSLRDQHTIQIGPLIDPAPVFLRNKFNRLALFRAIGH